MKRILCIESDRILAHRMQEFFCAQGYTVDVCADAQQAIFAADAHTPDIVVMEMALAGHSGVEFLYEFRSYSEWRRVPIVLLSRIPVQDIGLTDKTIKDLGLSAILYKPDTGLDKLAAKIEKCLEKSPV